jgi:hypothetical protein
MYSKLSYQCHSQCGNFRLILPRFLCMPFGDEMCGLAAATVHLNESRPYGVPYAPNFEVRGIAPAIQSFPHPF